MIRHSDDTWFASLNEVRRQAKHLADVNGLGSQVEGQSRFLNTDDADESWQMLSTFEKIADNGVWQEQQWLNAFECLFWETPSMLLGGVQQDDIMYFVLREQRQNGEPVLLVRRKGKRLPSDLAAGDFSRKVIWVDTVMLNLALQTAFRLDVTISRREDVSASEGKGLEMPAEARVVSGNVFASPSRVEVQGLKRRAGAETIVQAYPDICFSVDGSHIGFDQLVLKNPGYRLHVQLTAYDGIGLHAKSQDQHQAEAPIIASSLAVSSGNQVLEPVELLSGFVSYEQVADAMGTNKLGARILRKPDESVLSLRGPGGQGRALVTAKWIKISDSGHLLIEKQSSPSRPPNSIPVLGSLLERLKGTAISLVPGESKLSRTGIQCSMLEVSLPVALLAAMILRVPLKAASEE